MLKKFTGYNKVIDLMAKDFNWNRIPSAGGVYIVVFCKKEKPEFLEKGTGGYFKKKNPNVAIGILEKKWISFKADEEKILYIGQTNARQGLRHRIRQYVRFGQGKPVAKWGGRLIWQLAQSSNLEIHWREESNPRDVEKKMLLEFKQRHGRLPFANFRS